MLILKLTHWTRDWDDEVDPEGADPENQQDDSLYVNAERIIAMDADIQWRPGGSREKLEPVTRLVLTEHVHEQVTETPEEILELIRRGSMEGALPQAFRVKGYEPKEPGEKKEDAE